MAALTPEAWVPAGRNNELEHEKNALRANFTAVAEANVGSRRLSIVELVTGIYQKCCHDAACQTFSKTANCRMHDT